MKTSSVALVGLALAVGCASGPSNGVPTSGSGGTGAQGTAAQACLSEAMVSCGLLDSCSGSAKTRELYGTTVNCQTRRQLACIAALAARGSNRTPADVLACAQAEGALGCADYLLDNLPAACALPPGQLDAGAGCAFPAQCQSTFCALAPGALCGTCAPLPLAGSGCARSGCGPDLICGLSSETCLSPAPDGGHCTEANSCLPGLDCVGLINDGGRGVCEPSGTQVGQSCDYRRRTAAGCDSELGLYCAKQLCQLTEEAPAGAACGLVDGGSHGCPAGESSCVLTEQPISCAASGDCVYAHGASACLAAAADGALCDDAVGPGCTPPARCLVTSGGAAICTLPSGSLCP